MVGGSNYGGASGFGPSAVTFPSTFASEPIIVFSFQPDAALGGYVTLSSISATGFSFEYSADANISLNWIAFLSM
jgi:hypothetical protein